MKKTIKLCPKCGENRISMFGKNSNKKNGLASYCKKCRNIQRKIIYQRDKDKEKERSKNYLKTHRLERNAYDREKRKTNQKFKINRLISCYINDSLKGNKKGRHWEDLVGYNINDLIKRLKKTIPSGYSWDDFIKGITDLQIDHIVPIKAHNFNTYTDTDFKRCWALKNLQLLPAKKNNAKGSKINGHFQPSLLGI